MSNAVDLARAHWNETPLYLTEEARYDEYPWLCTAEFTQHPGEDGIRILMPNLFQGLGRKSNVQVACLHQWNASWKIAD
jgi:hypothetical protein